VPLSSSSEDVNVTALALLNCKKSTKKKITQSPSKRKKTPTRNPSSAKALFSASGDSLSASGVPVGSANVRLSADPIGFPNLMTSSDFSERVAQFINQRILPTDSSSTIPSSSSFSTLTPLPSNPKAEVKVTNTNTTVTSDAFEDIYKAITNDPEASRLLDTAFQMEVEWDAAVLPWEPLSSCSSSNSNDSNTK